jgi:hypothetical protein
VGTYKKPDFGSGATVRLNCFESIGSTFQNNFAASLENKSFIRTAVILECPEFSVVLSSSINDSHAQNLNLLVIGDRPI